jgi:two-component system phosphate regulon sensor histidine kinase PhoR
MLLLGADVEGKSPLEIVRHGELVRLFDEALEEASASGEIDLGGLKPRRLLVHVVRIPGEEGGLLAVFVDVTHLRRLETLRRDFVANASHELRTPVAAISSAAETLETALERDPAAARDFVQMIQRNAERLRNLVDDLLDLSRVESQDFAIRLETVDVREIVGAVVDLFRERASKKKIALTSEIVDGAGVLADRRGLEHVITNLVDNAVKYCPAGSRVTVRTVAGQGQAVIEVDDDGPGIEKEHLPRLFERFYRVDPGRSRELGGTGLGLSIVKHLVEAMRGSISVESEPGKGTRFVVRLKAASPQAASPEVPVTAEIPSSIGSA